MKSKDISKTKSKELTLSDTELNTLIDRIRWRNSVRIGKRFTDQIDNAIQILGSKPKNKRDLN